MTGWGVRSSVYYFALQLASDLTYNMEISGWVKILHIQSILNCGIIQSKRTSFLLKELNIVACRRSDQGS